MIELELIRCYLKIRMIKNESKVIRTLNCEEDQR